MFLILSILILLYLIILFCDIFTNAIENLGKYFNIQEGVLGSIFAAIGTAFPETVLPLIAVFGAYLNGSNLDVGQQIGKGAVLGSPFMLSTFAFFVVALTVCFLAFRKKRDFKIKMNVDLFVRDLLFFFIAYTIGVVTALIPNKILQIIIGIGLLFFYGVYAYKTITMPCTDEEFCEKKCDEKLIFQKFFKLNDKFKLQVIIFQLLFAIFGIVISSHFFVENIKQISTLFGISAMIISLFLAPVATELPETINGMVWSSKGKDTLAICNITGAMIFQACIPMAIGIFFTNWSFSVKEFANVFSVYCAFIILFLATRNCKECFNAKILLLSGIPYLLYLIFSILYVK